MSSDGSNNNDGRTAKRAIRLDSPKRTFKSQCRGLQKAYKDETRADWNRTQKSFKATTEGKKALARRIEKHSEFLRSEPGIIWKQEQLNAAQLKHDNNVKLIEEGYYSQPESEEDTGLGDRIMTFGKYKNMTWKELCDVYPNYCEWYANDYPNFKPNKAFSYEVDKERRELFTYICNKLNLAIGKK